jgi:hypothetical protein
MVRQSNLCASQPPPNAASRMPIGIERPKMASAEARLVLGK